MQDEFALRTMSCLNLAREIFDFLNVHLMKAAILRMLEQRYVINSLLKDRLAAKEISGRLSQICRANTMKKMQVF
jgi:hypothetical protein